MKWLDNYILKVTNNNSSKKFSEIEDRLDSIEKKLSLLEGNDILQDQELDTKLNKSAFDAFGVEVVKSFDSIKNDVQNRTQNLGTNISVLKSDTEDELSKIKNDLLKYENKSNQESDEIKGSIENVSKSVDEFKDVARNMNQSLSEFQEIKSKMDEGIILMTKNKLLGIIDGKIEVFEGNINNKISGLMAYVNNKSLGVVQDTELLKKLARMEELSDAIENRLPTEEILAKRQQLKETITLMQKESLNPIKEQSMLDALNWVLGE